MNETELSYQELLELAKLKKKQEQITDERNCKRIVLKYKTDKQLELLNTFKSVYSNINNNDKRIIQLNNILINILNKLN